MANNNRRRFGGFFSGPGFGGGGGAGGAGGGAHSLIGGAGGIFMGFILIIIGGGLLLTGDFNPLPNDQLTDPPEGVYEIDEESLKELDDKRGNLQLRTIRFKECGEQVAVSLLVDRSGSMAGQKIVGLQNALRVFSSSLGDESILGLISFSSIHSGITVREDIPISRYGDVKDAFQQAINSLNPPFGGTYTREALQFTKDRLIAAQSKYPEKTFALIIMTDGIPETDPIDCSSGRQYDRYCFAASQDPSTPPDIINEIKDTNVKVYSIALYDPSNPKDLYFLPDMKRVLQTLASAPENYFETPNPGDLERIYGEISTRICQSVGAVSPTP